MRKMTPKRQAIERKINQAKRNYVAERGNVCEACGLRGGRLGVSHIISVNECLNDPRYPEELAWSEENLTLECHDRIIGGYSCHTITEAKSGEGLGRKLEQLNLQKKMRIYEKYMPWLYDVLKQM